MLEKEYFLEKYRITENKFNQTNLSWKELQDIYTDYNNNIKKEAEDVIDNVVKKLRKSPDIHSIRARVKDPEHLIEKIIRKKIKDPERIISIENYKNEITDIIGIRMICLFKKNIKKMDTYIKGLHYKFNSQPVVNIREGDNQTFYKGIGEIKVHPAGYRSVHYNIKACDSSGEDYYICEVQLRTIFEEAWGEIDHTIRYPYLQEDPHLNDYFKALNRLSGLADEMADFSEDLANLVKKAKKSEEVEDLNSEVRRLKKELGKRDEKIFKYENKLKIDRDRKRERATLVTRATHRTIDNTVKITPATHRTIDNNMVKVTPATQRMIDNVVKVTPATQRMIDNVVKVTPATQRMIDNVVKVTPATQRMIDNVVKVTSATQRMIDNVVKVTPATQRIMDKMSNSMIICNQCNTLNSKNNHICFNCQNLLH